MNNSASYETKEELDQWPYKRVVVEVNEAGKSYIVTEKISSATLIPGKCLYAVLWREEKMPADNTVIGDHALGHEAFVPSPGGAVWRETVLFPQKNGVKNPEMQKQDALSMVYVLAGEAWLVTETDKTLMTPGDFCAVKGVKHAWSNCSQKPCVLYELLLDAKPFEPFEMSWPADDPERPDPNDARKTWKSKRIVVGTNADGKSRILTEKVSNVIKTEGMMHRADLWCTAECPVDNTIDHDRALDQNRREPFPGGSVARSLILWPDPEDKEAFIEFVKNLHKRVQNSHMPTEEDYRRHPNMHRTDSLDVISICKGEMYMVTDLDETLMGPGDVVIIRGGNHAWANHTNEPVVSAGTMTDAIPLD